MPVSKTSTPPILIGGLPRAEKEARRAFSEIQNNTYENKSLGKLKQTEEAFPCDCSFDPSRDTLGSHTACGEHADCINRLTQTECLESECRSKSHCQNQRFQRKQFANVEIVQTERKGFGLRAGSNIQKNDFIYEYIGEVVTENTLLRRMRAYNDEGIRHFYFMMLQKNEFIDATKRGGIGRFANHSCNPNCYVAKWFVGNRIRMGIFAKRAIQKDEEITFNYNVDRYGHDAQTCHCGEPNCVGFIGGKTQTEVATMDDVYIEALGLDEDQIVSLSINAPKRGKKAKKAQAQLEEELDFDLKPIRVAEVPSVVNAVRKALGSTRPMLVKLLSRLAMTEDITALRQFLRLRGLGLMADILEEYGDDRELTIPILSSVRKWPLSNRIKIEDVGFESKIQHYAESEDEELKSLTNEILEAWSKLEAGYRIPKRNLEDDDVPTIIHITLDDDSDRPRKRPRIFDAEVHDLPLPAPAPVPSRRSTGHAQWERAASPVTPKSAPVSQAPTQEQLDAIIARATATAAAMAAAAAPLPPPSPEKRLKSKPSTDKAKTEAHKLLKEKQLKKLVGGVVVKAVGKYAKPMGKEVFKKYAEECTNAISDKEKKSPTYATAKLDKLSDEKQSKIKKYAKEFFAKAMHKIEKKKSSRSGSGSSLRPPSTLDPRRSFHAGSVSGAAGEGSPPSTESTNGVDGEEVDPDSLTSEIFGDDIKLEDIDEEETLKAEQTPEDIDGDQLQIDTASASASNTPTDDGSRLGSAHSQLKLEGLPLAASPL